MIPVCHTLTDPLTNEMAFAIAPFSNGGYFGRLNRYNYFSMLLVNKGAGKLIRDNVEYNFEAGCLLCFSLYQPFAIYPEAVFEGILINFHPAFFCLYKHRNEVSCNGVLFNNLYDTPVVSLEDAEMQSLRTITLQMFNEFERECPDHDVVLSYLKIFLIESSRAKMGQREVMGNGQSPLMLSALQQAIDTHFKTLRMPGDYSKLLHISERALNKSCKQFFNKTLTSIIAERMAIEAKRELYLTAKPVKQIAYELGYNDEFYFSRFFKKNVGVSPQIFRDTVGFDKLNG
jgi:AraC family transcriptional activator of pobA